MGPGGAGGDGVVLVGEGVGDAEVGFGVVFFEDVSKGVGVEDDGLEVLRFQASDEVVDVGDGADLFDAVALEEADGGAVGFGADFHALELVEA